METSDHPLDSESSGISKKRKIGELDGHANPFTFENAGRQHSASAVLPDVMDNSPADTLRESQKIIIVNRVSCSRREAHVEHLKESYYLDCPRLFSGDHKASALRGRHRINDVKEYIDQHENTCVIIQRDYSCESFHGSVKEKFERLHVQNPNVIVGSRIRPYLFRLKDDTPEAPWRSEIMTVFSKSLGNTLKSLGCPENMKAPYLPLYHRRAHITQLLNGAQNIPDGLVELMEYFDENFTSEYSEADSLFQSGLVSRKHFAKMFGPDEIVVDNRGGESLAYMSTATPASGEHTFALQCWSWSFDGTFRKKNTELQVAWPGSASDILQIHDLGVYPLKFNSTGLEKQLRLRGEKFWGFRIKEYVSYATESLGFDVRVTNPRYMIDMQTYHQMHPKESEEVDEPGLPLDSEAMRRVDIPDDPFALLLPAHVLGYGLQDKKWRSLDVDFVEDVAWNSTAFERLVLSPRKKEIIKALVTVHVDTSASTDIIEGKGNGLIMLLHGSPGTGKTLTAESIAELTHKPLYRVTCGDIGTEPEAVEKYLESVLYIGTTWGCVVLLDEADVFLEERTQSDLQRNALVSVFLRVLEYYDGILILTSNRVGTFDEAFKSRIQLAVHYPRLDRRGRCRIWNGFISGLDAENDSIDVERLRENVDVLAQYELNGRQIRNTVRSARQLAYYKKERLGFEHFDAVIEVANEFEEYLAKVHGHGDSDWAKSQMIRAE